MQFCRLVLGDAGGSCAASQAARSSAASQSGSARRTKLRGGMNGQNQARRLFLGCCMALVATAFGFAVRGAVLEDWAAQFGLSEEQKGIIQGVGLYPFAISIIL